MEIPSKLLPKPMHVVESATSSSSRIPAIQSSSAPMPPELSRLPGPFAHRRSASMPAIPPDAVAPALHEMIGVERAGALDARFGSLQPPLHLDTDGIKPWEREGSSATGKPLMHPNRLFAPNAKGVFPALGSPQNSHVVDLEALKRGEKKYMWAIGALGRLIIGEELPAGRDAGRDEVKTLGHPTLVGGGTARVAGELLYDSATGKFIVTNRSGRYCRYEDRAPEALDDVVEMFKNMGLDAQPHRIEKYLTRKKREKLILPSLDPRRRAGPSND